MFLCWVLGLILPLEVEGCWPSGVRIQKVMIRLPDGTLFSLLCYAMWCREAMLSVSKGWRPGALQSPCQRNVGYLLKQWRLCLLSKEENEVGQ